MRRSYTVYTASAAPVRITAYSTDTVVVNTVVRVAYITSCTELCRGRPDSSSFFLEVLHQSNFREPEAHRLLQIRMVRGGIPFGTEQGLAAAGDGGVLRSAIFPSSSMSSVPFSTTTSSPF